MHTSTGIYYMIRVKGQKFVFDKKSHDTYYVRNLRNRSVVPNFYYKTKLFKWSNFIKAIHRHCDKFLIETKKRTREKEIYKEKDRQKAKTT